MISSKGVYRLLITIIISLIAWVVVVRFVMPIPFKDFVIVEIVVIISNMLSYYIKRQLGIEKIKE